jgi:hypothetical protein
MSTRRFLLWTVIILILAPILWVELPQIASLVVDVDTILGVGARGRSVRTIRSLIHSGVVAVGVFLMVWNWFAWRRWTREPPRLD